MYELIVQAFTTRDMTDTAPLFSFIADLQALFEIDDLRVHWPEGTSLRSSAYARLSRRKIEQLYLRDENVARVISLSDLERKSFWASVQWYQVRGEKNVQNFIRDLGYQQHQISLELDPELLQDEAFRTRFVSFCANQAVSFDVNYLYVRRRSQPVGVAPGIFGLEAGLRQIYWLNILGQPFLKLMERERLAAAPAHRVEPVGADHFLVQATAEFADPELDAACKRIQDYLGPDYFVDEEKLAQAEAQQQGGVTTTSIFNVFKLFKGARDAARSQQALAETAFFALVRPQFDWKHIFQDRDDSN